MIILVDNIIHVNLSDIPDKKLFEELKQGCTYDNPEYIEILLRFNQSQNTCFECEEKLLKADIFTNEELVSLQQDLRQYRKHLFINNSRLSKTPQYLHTYKLTDSELLIPRGKITFLKEKLNKYKIKYSFIDKRCNCMFKKNISFKKGKELFPYQKTALNGLVKYTQRLLSSDCGSGKTVIGCGIIQSLQQQTLIVVDMVDLLTQWSHELESFLKLSFKVGQIGSGKFEVKPITIALVQSLNTMSEEEWKILNNTFGCIIYDEVQGLPAPTRFDMITRFKAKYLYGLSATIKRSDKLEFFTYDSISPSIVSVDTNELKEADRFLDVELLFVKSHNIKNSLNDFKFCDWNALVNRLIYSRERNDVITKDIEVMVKLGHKSLVLSSRVEHCHILADILNKKGISSEVYVGDTKKQDRADIKEQLETGKVKCMIATYQCAQKALNIPCLSCLHLPLPIKDKNILQQATGRIRRVYPNKLKPMIRDYVDMSAPILKKKAKNRALIYQDLGYINIINHHELLVKIPKH